MKHFYAALTLSETGELVWPKHELKRWNQYKQIYKGAQIALQVSKLSPLRSSEHLGLMRIRFRDLKHATGYSVVEAMHVVFRSCGLGYKLEPKETNSFTKFFMANFDRLSTNVLTTEDVNKIMNKLEEFRIFWNDNEPQERHFEWSPYMPPIWRKKVKKTGEAA